MRRVGFLADTHSTKPDGSDLPDGVLRAFDGVDLVVHLGDVGRKGILERLGEIAPVLVPSGDGKGYSPAGSADDPVKVIEVGSARVGLTFNLTQPDKKITIEDGAPVAPDGLLESLLMRRFKEAVDVVAFAGTHIQYQGRVGDVLFFNPGSPTLPADRRDDHDLGSVAVLDCSKEPSVTLVRLSTSD